MNFIACRVPQTASMNNCPLRAADRGRTLLVKSEDLSERNFQVNEIAAVHIQQGKLIKITLYPLLEVKKFFDTFREEFRFNEFLF